LSEKAQTNDNSSSLDRMADRVELVPSESETLAAIDIGSNSFHLIVARLTNGTLQPLVQEKLLVRLAEGLNDKNELSSDAMERGLKALNSFGETVQNLKPSNIRIVATFTLRRAKNRNQFVRAAKTIFPFPVEVISGDEEARLIYQGVAHTSHTEGKRLVLDIGGGSTEFAIGKHFNPLQLSSQPMGCINYTRRFFADGKISLDRFQAAETLAQQRLEVIDRRFCYTGWDVAVATSGTAKAIAQYLDSKGWLESRQFNLEALRKMKAELIEEGHSDRISNMDDSRKPIIAAGLSIMIAAFKQLNVEQMSYADAALREGVLYELTERMQHQDIRERTVSSLVLRYDIDQEQSRRVLSTAELLFRAYAPTLAPNSELTSESESAATIVSQSRTSLERTLNWASTLHEIGLHINRRGIQRHSKYILENIEMPGFSDEEQRLLGVLVGSYRKKFQPDQLPEFSHYDPERVFALVVILRLATLLNQRRLDDYLPNFEFSISSDKAKITFPLDWLTKRPLVLADLRSESNILNASGFCLEIS